MDALRHVHLVGVVELQFPDFVFCALVQMDGQGLRRLHGATLQREGVDRSQHSDKNADKKHGPHGHQ